MSSSEKQTVLGGAQPREPFIRGGQPMQYVPEPSRPPTGPSGSSQPSKK